MSDRLAKWHGSKRSMPRISGMLRDRLPSWIEMTGIIIYQDVTDIYYRSTRGPCGGAGALDAAMLDARLEGLLGTARDGRGRCERGE